MSEMRTVDAADVYCITITLAEYNKLCESDKILTALQAAGVDNWDGYDYAMEMLEDKLDI